ERRSGLYILGRPGSGKTTLMKSLMVQDIHHGHGGFFLDPHGDAIEDLQQYIPEDREDDVIVLDPQDDEYTFGMNLFVCSDLTSLKERGGRFAHAMVFFRKL